MDDQLDDMSSKSRTRKRNRKPLSNLSLSDHMSIQAKSDSNTDVERALKEQLISEASVDSAAELSYAHLHTTQHLLTSSCTPSLLAPILAPTNGSVPTEPTKASSSFSCFCFFRLAVYAVTVFISTMLFWVGLSALLNQYTAPQTILRDAIYSSSGTVILAAVGTLLPNCFIFEEPPPAAAAAAAAAVAAKAPPSPKANSKEHASVAVSDAASSQPLCNLQLPRSLVITYTRAMVSLCGMVLLWVSLGNLLSSGVEAATSIPQLPPTLGFILIFMGCIILMEANGHLKAIGKSFSSEDNQETKGAAIDGSMKQTVEPITDCSNSFTLVSQRTRSRLRLYARAPFSLCGLFAFWIALVELLNRVALSETGPVASAITCAIGLVVLALANTKTIFDFASRKKKQTATEVVPTPRLVQEYKAVITPTADSILSSTHSEHAQLEIHSYQLMSQPISDISSTSASDHQPISSFSTFYSALHVRICGLFSLLGGLLFFIGSWNLIWNSSVKQFGVWLPLTYSSVGLVGLILTDTFLLNCGIIRNTQEEDGEAKRTK